MKLRGHKNRPPFLFGGKFQKGMDLMNESIDRTFGKEEVRENADRFYQSELDALKDSFEETVDVRERPMSEEEKRALEEGEKKARRLQEEAGIDPDTGLEKSDKPAIILAAILIFVPAILGLVLLLWLVTLLFSGQLL